jgi:hypothetical protein
MQGCRRRDRVDHATRCRTIHRETLAFVLSFADLNSTHEQAQTAPLARAADGGGRLELLLNARHGADVVASVSHGARCVAGAHGSVCKQALNKQHERSEVGHAVWHEHDAACRRQVCSAACAGAGLGLGHFRLCFECAAAVWEQVTLPGLLLAAPQRTSDGLAVMAYPQPVYAGFGPFGLREAAGQFAWTVPQTNAASSSFLRLLCARASAFLEDNPGVAASLTRSKTGAALLESVSNPTRLVARTLRGTKTIGNLAAGQTVAMCANEMSEIEMTTLTRHYASPLLMMWTRAGGSRLSSSAAHDADNQEVAQVVSHWATPHARPVSDVRYEVFDLASAQARQRRRAAADGRAASAVRPHERTSVRFFPPRVHACMARTSLAANVLGGAAGISVISGRHSRGQRFALAQAQLTQAVRHGRGHRHRDAAIALSFVIFTYLDEGRPMTDPVVAKAYLVLAHVVYEIASELAASRGTVPARHRLKQDRAAVLAQFYHQMIGAGVTFLSTADAAMEETLRQHLPPLVAAAAGRGVGTGAIGQTGMEHPGDIPLAVTAAVGLFARLSLPCPPPLTAALCVLAHR